MVYKGSLFNYIIEGTEKNEAAMENIREMLATIDQGVKDMAERIAYLEEHNKDKN